jgi:hypothetical protein
MSSRNNGYPTKMATRIRNGSKQVNACISYLPYNMLLGGSRKLGGIDIE